MKTIRNSFLIGGICGLLLACNTNKNDYDASGVFEATEIVVSSQGNGQIMKFYVEEGQTLENGQSVGYIDTIQLHLKKMQLLANMKSIGSRYRNVDTQIASLEEQIDKQRIEQRRYENLIKANAANQKQLDDINSQLSVLERELAAQRENLVSNNSGVAGDNAILQVQVSQLQDQIRKSIITSPIDGVVLTKYAENGEVTAEGRPLFKIADINHMYLRVYITSDQISQMQIGQEVKVYADFGEKGNREYTGRVSWISDKSEFTPKTIQTRNERDNLVYAVKIAVANDGYLKSGMYGEIRFQ